MKNTQNWLCVCVCVYTPLKCTVFRHTRGTFCTISMLEHRELLGTCGGDRHVAQ